MLLNILQMCLFHMMTILSVGNSIFKLLPLMIYTYTPVIGITLCATEIRNVFKGLNKRPILLPLAVLIIFYY